MREGQTQPPASLLVFSDDWGRHPSSCQHLIRQLVGRYAVCWVNTIGTRPPRLDLATLGRGLEKMRHWFRPRGVRESLPAGLQVLSPRMWPSFGSRFSRWLNRRLLLRQLTPAIRSLPGPVTAVTTIPIVADLIGELPVSRWVYYCVDDFGQWPGLDQTTLQRMDSKVITRVDVCIAVSETLQDRIRGLGREARLLTHGVDLDFWKGEAQQPELISLTGLERPLVVFWGVIDQRMDVSFVQRLSAELTRGTLLFLGPQASPDPVLFKIPHVVYRPPVPFEHLPAVAREATVLVMPYADLPVTRAMQPLKLKEYLATGKPAVVRDLPATRPWGDCLDLAESPESFSQVVRQRLREGLPHHQMEARSRLAAESWATKAEQFERETLGTQSVRTSQRGNG
jgi:glycosyltransferase involved in cell wall biosynthesis